VALPARRLLCKALGWERVLPLFDLIARIVAPGEARTSPDPTVGVFDVAAACSAMAYAGDAPARRA